MGERSVGLEQEAGESKDQARPHPVQLGVLLAISLRPPNMWLQSLLCHAEAGGAVAANSVDGSPSSPAGHELEPRSRVPAARCPLPAKALHTWFADWIPVWEGVVWEPAKELGTGLGL